MTDASLEPATGRSLWDVLAEWTLYVSAGLIVVGALRPSIYKPGLLQGTDYDLPEIIMALMRSDHQLLAAIVALFSGVFPLAKTLAAAIVFRTGGVASVNMARLLGFLGKWSMLDVFLAAMLVAVTQLATIASIEPRSGLYIFAIGVILNNLATARLSFSRAS